MTDTDKRKLDTLMATEGMGWERCRATVTLPNGEPAEQDIWRKGSQHISVHAFRPTEDISQAFMVVDAMVSGGYEITLHMSFIEGNWVDIERDGNLPVVYDGETPALAICLAAEEAIAAEEHRQGQEQGNG